MSFSLSFIDDADWLVAVTKGEISSLDALVERLGRVFERASAFGRKRVLLYDRDLDVRVDALDIATAAALHEEQGVSRLGMRLACVCAPGCRPVCSVIETMLRNRSISYRLFAEEDEAVAWLSA